MKKRFLAVLAIATLIATACGSRVDDERGDDDRGVDAAVDDQTDSNDETEDEPSGPSFGTLEAPCNETPDDLDGEFTDAPGTDDDTIRIGVISDKAGVVKVPTISVEESTEAFVEWCNDLGGINGRDLVLETYDAELTAGDQAAKEACSDDLFALVGTGAVMDDLVAPVVVDCGLVNVAGYAATAKMALADLTVTPVPNPSNHFNTSPGLWIQEQFPEAVEHAAMLAADLPTATVQADRIVDAYEMIDMDFVYRKNTDILQTSYAAEISEMKSADVEYVTMVSETSETMTLLKDMVNADFTPEVIDLGQQYYERALLEEPGAEGAYVQTNTVPFEDGDEVPAMRDFLEAYDEIDSDVKPTSLGVQAFSAGLLFATAARDAGADLDRETLMDELGDITEWDGGGLHYEANPGDNEAARCFAYMQVENGEFVRHHPSEIGTFDCTDDEDVVVDLGSDYGGGAKVGS